VGGQAACESPANRLQAASRQRAASSAPEYPAVASARSSIRKLPRVFILAGTLQDGQSSLEVRHRHLDVVIETPRPPQRRIDGLQALLWQRWPGTAGLKPSRSTSSCERTLSDRKIE